MSYRYSQDDKSNKEWFVNDYTRQSLRAIIFIEGQIRSLKPCSINFEFPIAAIAGKNGSGKSTLLALAACAFHNTADGSHAANRAMPYYRFSDFFFQTLDEIPLGGIKIYYQIAHDKWKKSEERADGRGIASQVRSKNRGGKWNDYDLRVKRNVIFLGIDRIVPPSEKSSFRSVRHKLKDLSLTSVQELARQSVASVLGVSYDELKVKSHGKFRLPVVTSAGVIYSGFNMGAGEKALFEIFIAIHAAPDGSLFVIDEIEIGLHESAQSKLMKVLKEICRDRKIQVICTTHSQAILRSLPPEGRFYLERNASKTTVLSCITSEYATGKMADRNSGELVVYVEDEFAKTLLTVALPKEIRARISIISIGNATAIAGQLAAAYRRHLNTESVAILDGDNAATASSVCQQVLKQFSGSETKLKVKDWIERRIVSLPGPEAPERYVLRVVQNSDLSVLVVSLGCFDKNDLEVILGEVACLDDAHDIVRELSHRLHLPASDIEQAICRHAVNAKPEEFQGVYDAIKFLLDQQS